MKQAHRFSGSGRAYEGLTELGPNGPRWTGKIKLVEELLEQPLHWKKPQKIFVNSMSDLFHEDVPFEFIDKVFAVMALCSQHTFQILTKRADRMREYFATDRRGLISNAADPMCDNHDWMLKISTIHDHKWNRWPLPNVWLGVSVENQDMLRRIDVLKDVPAAVRFVSFEPLLEDLGALILDRIDWAIVGGESGPKARLFRLNWAANILRQCRPADVAFFFKQTGGNLSDEDLAICARESGRSMHDSHGGDPEEWPHYLRVREFPRVNV